MSTNSIESLYVKDHKDAKEKESKMNIKEFEFFKTWSVVNPEEHSKMRMHMFLSDMSKLIDEYRLFTLPSTENHRKYIDKIEEEILNAKECISSSIDPMYPSVLNNKKKVKSLF